MAPKTLECGDLNAPRRLAGIVIVGALLAAAGILVYQVLVPPVVGLADNGDFDRILGPMGFKYQAPDDGTRYFQHLTLQYDAGRPWRPRRYLTSEFAFAVIARLCALGLRTHGVFDVRYLGAVHGVVLLAGLALLILGGRGLPPAARAAGAVLLVFIFTDVGYAALLNSFFSTAGSLLFFLLLAGAVLGLAGRPDSRPFLAAYWLTALLFVTSKPQESVLAPWLALLAILLAREGATRGRRRAIGMGAALCFVAAIYCLSTTTSIRSPTTFNHVFLDILPNSPDARADLRELGLPPDWVVHSGTNAFQPGSAFEDPRFQKTLLDLVGDRQILGFYLNHPRRLLERVRSAAGHAVQLRPSYLGNFAASSGAKPFARSRAFAAWSSFKAGLAPHGAWLLPVFWLANLAGSVLVLRRSANPRNRRLAASVAVLCGMAVTEFFVCVFADSFVDLERHLLSFNAMTDLIFVGDLVWIVSASAALVAGHSEMETNVARVAEREPRPDALLSVVIPVCNEADNIGPMLADLARDIGSRWADFEVVVVDDGSRDATAEITAAIARDDLRVRLVQHPRNEGYGAALRTGFANARNELIFLTDGDRQFDLGEIDRLLERFPDADMVVGYRHPRRDPLVRRLNGQAWNWLTRLLLGVPERDVDCAFKLIRRPVIDRLLGQISSGGATFSAELLARAQRAGFRICEVPLSGHRPRTAGSPSGARLGVILRAFRELMRLRIALWRENRAS